MNNVQQEELNLQQFSNDVHMNAINHGWWDNEREVYETVALIHSEWTEALEEYRNRKPLLYYADSGKPEGQAIELIDGCIRILDLVGRYGYNFGEGSDTLNKLISYNKDSITDALTLPLVVTELHGLTSSAYRNYQHDAPETQQMCFTLVTAVSVACAWVKAKGLDPAELLITKHRFNIGRPYKHGNKAI